MPLGFKSVGCVLWVALAPALAFAYTPKPSINLKLNCVQSTHNNQGIKSFSINIRDDNVSLSKAVVAPNIIEKVQNQIRLGSTSFEGSSIKDLHSFLADAKDNLDLEGGLTPYRTSGHAYSRYSVRIATGGTYQTAEVYEAFSPDFQSLNLMIPNEIIKAKATSGKLHLEYEGAGNSYDWFQCD